MLISNTRGKLNHFIQYVLKLIFLFFLCTAKDPLPHGIKTILSNKMVSQKNHSKGSSGKCKEALVYLKGFILAGHQLLICFDCRSSNAKEGRQSLSKIKSALQDIKKAKRYMHQVILNIYFLLIPYT